MAGSCGKPPRQVTGEPLGHGEPLVERGERGLRVLRRRAEDRDRPAQRFLLGGGRLHRLVELGDQPGQLRVRPRESVARPGETRDRLRQLVARRPGQRLRDDRRIAERRGARRQRLVQRLATGQLAHGGILGHGLGSGRRRVERGAEPLDCLLQPDSHVRRQRIEHLVDLDRIRRVRDRDRPAAMQRRRPRGPRREVDVEVALEEQPRADPGSSRPRESCRAPEICIWTRREIGVTVAADARDLAHADAADPHRRARDKQVRVPDDRVDRVVLLERDRLCEREVDADRQQRDPDEARSDR